MLPRLSKISVSVLACNKGIFLLARHTVIRREATNYAVYCSWYHSTLNGRLLPIDTSGSCKAEHFFL